MTEAQNNIRFVKKSIKIDAKGKIVQSDIILPANTKAIIGIAIHTRTTVGQFPVATTYDDSQDFDAISPTLRTVTSPFTIPKGAITIHIANDGPHDATMSNSKGSFKIKAGRAYALKEDKRLDSFDLDPNGSELQVLYY